MKRTLLPQEFKSLTDGFLAYSFKYPATISRKPANIIFSRKPERYSSAAPLTPDARQRIVAELVSFLDGITISVSVKPATRPCDAEAHSGLPASPTCDIATWRILHLMSQSSACK